MTERLAELAQRKDEALHAGSERSVERQHAKGKLLARERIEYLLDEGSFHELDMLARHRPTRAASRSGPTPTASSPGGAPSTVGRSSSSRRTSPSSAGPSARSSPRRSTR
jgi:acetyl-CoA carboxylase carboxyltransferase component